MKWTNENKWNTRNHFGMTNLWVENRMRNNQRLKMHSKWRINRDCCFRSRSNRESLDLSNLWSDQMRSSASQMLCAVEDAENKTINTTVEQGDDNQLFWLHRRQLQAAENEIMTWQFTSFVSLLSNHQLRPLRIKIKHRNIQWTFSSLFVSINHLRPMHSARPTRILSRSRKRKKWKWPSFVRVKSTHRKRNEKKKMVFYCVRNADVWL